MFGKVGLEGTRYFLKNFADGTALNTEFSLIAEDVHEIRNIIAHRAYSKRQHDTQYFIDDIPEGWRREADGSLTINPAIYSIRVEQAFRNSTIYRTFCAQSSIELLKVKYKFVKRWLELEKNDPISTAVNALEKLNSSADSVAEDEKIRSLVYAQYNL